MLDSSRVFLPVMAVAEFSAVEVAWSYP